MRDQLRDLISGRIHAADCGCTDFRPDGSDTDDAYYRRLADSVTELFPDGITESWMVRGVDPDFGDDEWTMYPKSREAAETAVREAVAKGGTAQAFQVLELRTAQPVLAAGDPS